MPVAPSTRTVIDCDIVAWVKGKWHASKRVYVGEDEGHDERI